MDITAFTHPSSNYLYDIEISCITMTPPVPGSAYGAA